MKKAVNMWKLYLPELYQMLVIMSVCEVVGIVLVRIIMSVDPTVEGYAMLGTFLAMLLGMFVTVISCIFSYGTKFNLAVSMGCTRKEFFFAHWIGTILIVLIEIAALLIFGLLETGLGKIMYNTFLSEELNLLPYLMNDKVIIALLLFVPEIGIFVGSLVMKYQMKAFWVLWAIWMIFFLGCVKISELISEDPEGKLADVVSGVFSFFKEMTGPVLVLLFLVIFAVMFGISAILVRKQEVR